MSFIVPFDKRPHEMPDGIKLFGSLCQCDREHYQAILPDRRNVRYGSIVLKKPVVGVGLGVD